MYNRGGGSNFPVVRLDAKFMVKDYGTIIAHSILTSTALKPKPGLKPVLTKGSHNWLTFSRTLGKDVTTWLVGTIANTWQRQLIASCHV